MAEARRYSFTFEGYQFVTNKPLFPEKGADEKSPEFQNNAYLFVKNLAKPISKAPVHLISCTPNFPIPPKSDDSFVKWHEIRVEQFQKQLTMIRFAKLLIETYQLDQLPKSEKIIEQLQKAERRIERDMRSEQNNLHSMHVASAAPAEKKKVSQGTEAIPRLFLPQPDASQTGPATTSRTLKASRAQIEKEQNQAMNRLESRADALERKVEQLKLIKTEKKRAANEAKLEEKRAQDEASKAIAKAKENKSDPTLALNSNFAQTELVRLKQASQQAQHDADNATKDLRLARREARSAREKVDIAKIEAQQSATKRL